MVHKPENMRSTDPVIPTIIIQKPVVVRPVQPVIIRETVPVRQPEVQQKELTPVKVAELPHKPEEKSSDRKIIPPKLEETASETQKKRKVRYEGEGGRIHTESQIDEILDFYLMTKELPIYVSDRQRYDYRHHERLPERKELLEQRGVSIVIDLSGSARRAKNIIPIKGAKPQSKKRASH
jgi:hypothetical protein